MLSQTRAHNEIAIITRTRNRPKLLERAVDALLKLEFSADRLCWIVVNDGGDPLLVANQAQRLERSGWSTKLVHHAVAKGRPAAANAGLALVDAPFAILHDDDDWLAPNGLTALYEALQLSTESVAAVGNYIERIETSDSSRETGNRVVRPPSPITLLDVSARNRFPPICMLFRADAALKAGGFSENHLVLEDWMFHFQLLLVGPFVRVELPVGCYTLRPSATGDIANAVVSERIEHEECEARIRDEIIRQSISNGTVSIGTLMLAGQIANGIEKLEGRFVRIRALFERFLLGRHLWAALRRMANRPGP